MRDGPARTGPRSPAVPNRSAPVMRSARYNNTSNTPIVITELPVSLDAEEFAMFNAVKRSDIYGDDDAAALRDLLFSWWEERFLQAHAGAPAIESK